MRNQKHKKTSGPTPITGIILPCKWDEHGEPTRIAIHTDNRKEYQIDFGGAGKQLLNLTNKKVEVHGKLREQLNGQATLCVRQYQVLKDAPDNIPLF